MDFTSSTEAAAAAALAGIVVGSVSSTILRRIRPDWRSAGAGPMVAVVWAGVSLSGGTAAAWTLAWWCACLSSIDVGSRRLPDAVTGTGAITVAAYGYAHDSMTSMLVGAAALFACYASVHLVVPRALGAGDVKLAWVLGGVAGMAGIDAWAVAAVVAPLLTGVCGVVACATGRRRARVPHGPAMCLATLLALAA